MYSLKQSRAKKALIVLICPNEVIENDYLFFFKIAVYRISSNKL